MIIIAYYDYLVGFGEQESLSLSFTSITFLIME